MSAEGWALVGASGVGAVTGGIMALIGVMSVMVGLLPKNVFVILGCPSIPFCEKHAGAPFAPACFSQISFSGSEETGGY